MFTPAAPALRIAAIRATPLLALLALLALAGCAGRGNEGQGAAAATVQPRQPLPVVSPGASRATLEAALAGWPPGRRFSVDPRSGEGWEWSGPDGMRVEAWLEDGRVSACAVSRTWGSGVPPVETGRLPEGIDGHPLGDLEAAIGSGLLVERSWPALPASAEETVLETHRWAIHDRGVDTGLYLTVQSRNGVVASVAHRWSAR